jgi:hypothetical protein
MWGNKKAKLLIYNNLASLKVTPKGLIPNLFTKT